MRKRHGRNQGFTLIELSIVLVIIGLIIGGVLVGQDLIAAAGTRATIAQIEKYNTAVNTFYVKYGYLPGDIPDPYASRFGFQARGGTPGTGNGDGLIEGFFGSSGAGWLIGGGEAATFWVDLSTARLIDGSFSTASPTSLVGGDISGTPVGLFFPYAKLGNGNNIYVWSTNTTPTTPPFLNPYPDHYFGISAVTTIYNATQNGAIASHASISVAQAYNIDKKIDDGLPLSGKVLAMGLATDPAWVVGNQTVVDELYSSIPTSSSLSPSSSSCIDNAGNASNTMQYSMTQNGGAGGNCILSIKMQGAAR